MHHSIRVAAAVALAALTVTAVAAASLDNGSLNNADATAGRDDSAARAPIDAAKADTAQFVSLAAAKAAGYGLMKDKRGISCIAMPPMAGMAAGAMGVHYANPKLVGDGGLSFDKPEALVYQPVAGGKLRLAALEYVVIKSAWDKTHATEPVMFGHKFNETYGGNRFGLPAFYSLHVWLFKDNPSGRFAMWNPLVHCGGRS